MKVLLVHNRYRSAFPSGENAVVDDEAELLAEAGCDVERLEVESDSIAELGAARRALVPAGVVWSRSGGRLTSDAIARVRPDVVHFHNTFPLLSPAALVAARRSGATVVQTLHNFRPLCPAGTFLRDGVPCEDCLGRAPIPALRHGCYRGSRAATAPLAAMVQVHRSRDTWGRAVDRFVVPSEFARSKFVKAGWPGDRLVVKHNTARDPGVRREGPGTTFVCVSRLSRDKGVDLLLDAWAQAFPNGGARLVVVGSGEEEAALRERAASLHGVELRGRVDRAEVAPLLAEARALVLPSRAYEVFPRVIVEAFSVGVPVLSFAQGAIPELVADGRTGLLAAAGSTSELADALRRTASSDELSLALGDGARAAYVERFGPEPTIATLLSVYDAARVSAEAA